MSRAFVKEDESGGEDTHRAIPKEPFPATAASLAQWNEELSELENIFTALTGKQSPEEQLELRRVTKELAFLRARIGLAVVSERDLQDQVGFGAHVTLEDEDGERFQFILVGSEEIDPASGRISCLSPLGQALMGRKIGDTVTWLKRGRPHPMTVITIE